MSEIELNSKTPRASAENDNAVAFDSAGNVIRAYMAPYNPSATERGAEAGDVVYGADSEGNPVKLTSSPAVDLGTAAYIDVGTDAGQIPQNSDLGEAAYLDTGTAPGNIPLNSDLGSASLLDSGMARAEVPVNSDLVKLSITELANTNAEYDGQAIYLSSGGRSGTFIWDASDLSGTLVTATATSDSVDSGTDTITDADHPFSNGDGVAVTAAVNGLSTNTVYYVVNATSTTYQLSSTYGGSAFDLTGTTNITVNRLLDPLQGVYVTPASDITGASGGWARKLDGYVTPGMYGHDGATVNDAASQAAIDSGTSVLLDADYPFESISFGSDVRFISSGGSFSGVAVTGSRPSRATIIAAGSSAARLALLQAYYGSVVTVNVGATIKGILPVSNALIKSGTATAINVSGSIEYSDCMIYGLQCTVDGVLSGSDMISTDAQNIAFYVTGRIDDETCQSYYSTGDGFRLTEGGAINCPSGAAEYNAEDGVFFWFGGSAKLKNFVASNNGNHGVVTNYGADADMENIVIDSNGATGLVWETGANGYAINATITNNGGAGIFINGAELNANNATLTGNSLFAVDGRTDFYLDIESAQIDLTNNSGGTQVRTLGGYITAIQPGTGGVSSLVASSYFPKFNTTGKAGGWIGQINTNNPYNFIGGIEFDPSTVTIAAGVITPESTAQKVDTEGLAATDDLDTISITSQVSLCFITAASGTRDVVIKNGTGNIVTSTGADITLDTLDKAAIAYKCSTKWLVMPMF